MPSASSRFTEGIEAEKTAPEIARQAIEMVRALYAVEKQAAALSVEKKLGMREAQSVPLLAELREKFLAWKEQLLPRHPWPRPSVTP
jgi:transposase